MFKGGAWFSIPGAEVALVFRGGDWFSIPGAEVAPVFGGGDWFEFRGRKLPSCSGVVIGIREEKLNTKKGSLIIKGTFLMRVFDISTKACESLTWQNFRGLLTPGDSGSAI